MAPGLVFRRQEMPEFKPASELSLDHESMGLEARVSKADHQSLRLWLRLLSSSTEIEAEIRRRMRSQFDMALAHFDYLAQLYRYPDGLSMRLLSRYLMVTGGNVTGLTDDMENEGFVSREMSPGDRRSYTVKLTRQGRKMFEQVASVHETWVVELFAGLKSSERDQLIDLLGRLRLQMARTLHGTRHERSPAPTASAAAPRRRRAA
jgi:DNA-binding MarR family transcriptional regulator